ncbi:transcriptional regulatory protein AlgP-like isoform X2 [Cyprinus carpio]|uniref:Transcriptional regulatory protein AlgP-like isoform X2 n=1 Tax=Cyprinus carpio TaxID=7962 RepID=A0A9Q9VPX0_CYPCA|nr:transcriptional regulatory protein AlgP-like isoform X2 [Cyprinus carpio]
MFLCFVYLSGVFNCSDRRLLKIRTCSLKNSSLKKKKLLSLKGLSHRTRYARRWTLGSALPFRYNVICAVLCQEQSMFHIVSFLETNEVEVVPSSWVDGDQCVWPRLRGESLTKAVKLAMKPKKEWKIFKVKLLYTTDNYDDARKKLPEAELFSDIQSDTESGAKKPRRIMKSFRLQNFKLLSDSDDDDDNEGQNLKGLEPPPRIKPPAFQTFSQSTQRPSSARQQPPLCQPASQPPASDQSPFYKPASQNHQPPLYQPASQPPAGDQSPFYQPASQPPASDQSPFYQPASQPPASDQSPSYQPASQPPASDQSPFYKPASQNHQPPLYLPASQPSASDQSPFHKPASQPPASNQSQFYKPASQPPASDQSQFYKPASQPPASDQFLFYQPASQPPAWSQPPLQQLASQPLLNHQPSLLQLNSQPSLDYLQPAGSESGIRRNQPLQNYLSGSGWWL